MKTVIFLVALAMTSAAWGQAQQKEAEKPAGKPAAPESAKAKPATPAKVARKSKREQDARHCLQRSGNTEIIKCAEEFL
jgi:hypothetical protein